MKLKVWIVAHRKPWAEFGVGIRLAWHHGAYIGIVNICSAWALFCTGMWGHRVWDWRVRR